MTRALPFSEPPGELDLAELQEIARGVAERRDLWAGDLRRTEGQRTYTEVFTNDHLGVWAISWMDDSHDTGFHDHGGVRGAVHVAEGVIRHEHMRLGERPVGRQVSAGEGFRFDDTVIHRMRHEPGAGPTVTVHAYSPPLTETGQYGEADDGLLHRVPTSSEEHLAPKGNQGTPSERTS